MHAPLANMLQTLDNVSAVADYEPLAREQLTDATWTYLTGGAGDELTLAENNAAFRRLFLRTRVLAI